MTEGIYVCNLCVAEQQPERTNVLNPDVFTVPADEIGVAVMKEHLLREHGIQTP